MCSPRSSRKNKTKTAKFPELEQKLKEWVVALRSQESIVTRPMIRLKVMQVKIDIGIENFDKRNPTLK